MRHRASPRFWECYRRLPQEVQNLSDRSYRLLCADAKHPSLQFKKIIPGLWSVRVGLHYRALAAEEGEAFIWVWIGTHAEYDRLLHRRSN